MIRRLWLARILKATSEGQRHALNTQFWAVRGRSSFKKSAVWAVMGVSRRTLTDTEGNARKLQNPCNYWGFGSFTRERATGIEPAFSAWEGVRLNDALSPEAL